MRTAHQTVQHPNRDRGKLMMKMIGIFVAASVLLLCE
jgi:hypothetical protein